MNHVCVDLERSIRNVTAVFKKILYIITRKSALRLSCLYMFFVSYNAPRFSGPVLYMTGMYVTRVHVALQNETPLCLKSIYYRLFGDSNIIKPRNFGV